MNLLLLWISLGVLAPTQHIKPGQGCGIAMPDSHIEPVGQVDLTG
jgi:hypothetical protein